LKREVQIMKLRGLIGLCRAKAKLRKKQKENAKPTVLSERAYTVICSRCGRHGKTPQKKNREKN